MEKVSHTSGKTYMALDIAKKSGVTIFKINELNEFVLIKTYLLKIPSVIINYQELLKGIKIIDVFIKNRVKEYNVDVIVYESIPMRITGIYSVLTISRVLILIINAFKNNNAPIKNCYGIHLTTIRATLHKDKINSKNIEFKTFKKDIIRKTLNEHFNIDILDNNISDSLACAYTFYLLSLTGSIKTYEKLL